VGLGGALGTFLRVVVLETLGAGWGLDASALAEHATLILINTLGAFLLGVLTGRMSGQATQGSRFRDERIRAAFGTGLMGGFTSYSALATALITIGVSNPGPIGIALATGVAVFSLIVGVMAAWLGVWLGTRVAHRRRDDVTPEREL